MTRLNPCLSIAAGVLLAFGPALQPAHAASKPAAPKSAPAKPAAAPKSAPAKPAGGAAGASHGAPGATTHTGPTTGAPHTGPTTSKPAGPSTAKPSTSAKPSASPARPSAAPTKSGTPGNPSRPGGGVKGSNPNMKTSATGRPAPKNSNTFQTKNGAVTKRANGKISDVHDAKRGMDVHHGLNGSRRVSVERADHSRVVAERGRPGYVERRYGFHGHDYARRSYYYHGRAYDRFYRDSYYHGVAIGVYAPSFYYAPGFYGWAYNPWAVSVSFGWGFAAAPWYGYYGFYFNPYPVYAAPSLWLTDYLISTELAAAYAAQAEAHTEAVAAAASGGQPILTPDVKAEIADEVKAQIALENSEAQKNAANQEVDPNSSGIGRLLADGKMHVFVAGSSLDVVDSNGAECAVSDGDALQMAEEPGPDATAVNMIVLSSKGSKECAKAATVSIAVADLQEMQNHMRETIDQGLKEMQEKQGKGGLPAAPASATAAPVESAFAQSAPPPEQNGAQDVQQQLTEADKVDQEAASAAPTGPEASPIGGVQSSDAPAADAAPAAAPVSISVGMTIADVEAALGKPVTIINLGPKTIYKYKDMKITFKAGKVSDVE